MAFVEIPDEPYTPRSFFKFVAVGDKFAGRYVSQSENANGYGTDYVFKGVDGEFVVTAKGALKAKFDKAGLKPGYKVITTYVGTQDVGKESPMRLFKVLVDATPGAAPAAKPAAPKPPPPPPAPPAGDEFDDIPL